MYRDGVIRPSQSSWASPVVLAPKPGGGLRFCVDYRKLNESTIKDRYPIPRMDDCVDSLGNAKVFTSVDGNSGYWQLEVAEEDKHKTAFTSHAGFWEFNRMPFGLTNAPASFQRLLDLVLAKYKWQTCLVYIDDVIVFSKSIADHIKDVDLILQELANAGMTLRLKKCSFFTDRIKYLGHIIRPGRLEIDRAHVAPLKDATPPETITQLRSFLGFANV